MKYVRRILSGLELLAGYLFLLFLSYAFTRNQGTGILDMPSYYREVSRSPLMIVGGAAVLLALFASLFSWIRTKLDLRAEATRREMIRTDVTEKTPKRPAMPGLRRKRNVSRLATTIFPPCLPLPGSSTWT